MLASRRGEDDPEVATLRQREEDKRQRVLARDELFGLRAAYRYGLCAWTLQRLGTASDPEEWVEFFEHFACSFADVDDAWRAANLALSLDAKDEIPWSEWIEAELPERQAHVIDSETGILRTLATLLLRSAEPDYETITVGLHDRLANRLEILERALDDVAQDENLLLARVLPVDHLQERVQALQTKLRSVADEHRRLQQEKIREADLDPEKVKAFKAAIYKTWSENRLAASLFELVESYEDVEDPEVGGDIYFRLEDWIRKVYLVTEPNVFGGDNEAWHKTVALTKGETEHLVKELKNSPKEQVSGTPAEAVASVIRRMRGEKLNPSVVIARPTLRPRLLVQSPGSSLGTQPDFSPPEDLPVPAAKYFLAQVEGVPVFGSTTVPEGLACVVDLAAFGSWRQFAVNQVGKSLETEIEPFDEANAIRLAHEHPHWFRDAERESAEARANEIRERVYLRIQERFEMQVKDWNAARWVELS
jgi:hypothetical protein